MTVFLEFTYKFNAISVKIPPGFFKAVDKMLQSNCLKEEGRDHREGKEKGYAFGY